MTCFACPLAGMFVIGFFPFVCSPVHFFKFYQHASPALLRTCAPLDSARSAVCFRRFTFHRCLSAPATAQAAELGRSAAACAPLSVVHGAQPRLARLSVAFPPTAGVSLCRCRTILPSVFGFGSTRSIRPCSQSIYRFLRLLAASLSLRQRRIVSPRKAAEPYGSANPAIASQCYS
jgi:hypothetical protein